MTADLTLGGEPTELVSRWSIRGYTAFATTSDGEGRVLAQG
jgi:hypothetical protein